MVFDSTPVLGSTILDRKRAKLRAKTVTDLATPMLKEVVDVGCAIYDRCLQVTQRAFLHKPALALYRHVLGTTDAIQVLIESSCVESVVPLLRSGLEGAMSLEYLFRKDYSHRSLVWNYHRLSKDLWQYSRANPDAEKLLVNFGSQEKTELDRKERDIERPIYSVLHDKFKDKQRPPDNWYQWVSDGGEKGPTNRRDLADKLGWQDIYWSVYKPFSRKVHADVYPYTDELRHPEGIQDYTSETVDLTNYCGNLMIEKVIIPMATFEELHRQFKSFHKQFKEWHGQIKDRMNQIEKLEIDFDNAG